jgi:hypothetical protein
MLVPMRPSARPALALALAACFGSFRPSRIDPKRFQPRPEWTPQAYAVNGAPAADPAAAISREDGIQDVAFLDHALAEAWPDADGPMGELVRDRARDAPLTAHTAGALCDELARQMHNVGLTFAIAGRPCGGSRAAAQPVEPLAEIPDGKNYAYRIDHAAGENGAPDTDVPVLAIARFVDPADAGWDGFGDVLADLATRDVVMLDLQNAEGSDPRMGFAILTAFTRTNTDNLGWAAPRSSDSAYAQVARANLAARGPVPPPRSRALWAGFGAPRDLAALSPVTVPARAERLAQLDVIVGRDCEAACGVIASVAVLASGPFPSARVDLLGGVAASPRDDELGVIRLPKSGIEVTFATAIYGPSLLATSEFVAPQPGFAAASLHGLHLLASTRAQARTWSAGPLPACKDLSSDLAALHKVGGCPPSWIFDARQAAPPNVSVMGSIALDAVHTKEFLDGCPGVRTTMLLSDDLHGDTLISIDGDAAAVARVASAPFTRELEWSCPMELESTASRSPATRAARRSSRRPTRGSRRVRARRPRSCRPGADRTRRAR